MTQQKEIKVSFAELALVALTRAAIGAGAGLLLANKLSAKVRRVIGLPLFIGGVFSTLPIALRLFGKEKENKTFSE